jgi:hypothetical protein
MRLYVVTVVLQDRIEEQAVYTDIDKAVQGMISKVHRIAEQTDVSYKRVKELEQDMWLSTRDPDLTYKYIISFYGIYIKMFTVN